MTNGQHGRVGAGARDARVDVTRASLLDAAERLFAEHGVQSVSNRQVSEAAKQGNNAAVGYHFGNKADLVRAVIRRHQAPIEQAREAALADQPQPPSLRDWVECLVRPSADHLAFLQSEHGTTYFARVSGQVLMDPELRSILIEEADSSSLRATLTGLDGMNAALPEMVRRERNVMSRQLMTWGFAQRESALSSGRGGPGWDAYATMLVDAVTGLWRAPSATE